VKSRAGYVLAALCLLAGVGIAGWFVWTGIGDLQAGMTRFVAPGNIDLTLDQSGTYTIFHESESVVDGKLYSAPTIGGLRITVVDADGKPIAVTAPSFSAHYSIGGHTGDAVLVFTIPAPGRYRLSAAYPSGQAEPKTVLVVGQGFVGRLLQTVFGAVGSAFVGFIAALVLGLTTYFRRRRLLQPPRSSMAGTDSRMTRL
jgi:hypothetical protein